MSDVVHTAKTGWILSGGRDKYFHYHCVNTGLTLSVVAGYFFVLFLLFLGGEFAQVYLHPVETNH